MNQFRTAAALALCFALGVPLHSYGQAPAPAFTADDLTAWPTESWITNGGNVFNQRYSPLDQINRDTIARLEPLWRASLNGSGLESRFSGQAQALFWDGVIYIATGPNDIFALDIETGDI